MGPVFPSSPTGVKERFEKHWPCTVADRTVAVRICKQCDLNCDPRCLNRIWHLHALLPLPCLVCPDSSALGIGDVVLQRHLTGEHFCTSSQPCPRSACCWLPCFLICVYCCRATASFWPWLTPQSSLHINRRPPWNCLWGGLAQPDPAKGGQ